MIGKNLTQEECNWPSKFQGMDFNIIKILFSRSGVPGHIAYIEVYKKTEQVWNRSQRREEALKYEIFKKYKTFSVLIYSYVNTSGNWKNEKLCGINVLKLSLTASDP